MFCAGSEILGGPADCVGHLRITSLGFCSVYVSRYKELYIELWVEAVQIGKCSDFTLQIILNQMTVFVVRQNYLK